MIFACVLVCALGNTCQNNRRGDLTNPALLQYKKLATDFKLDDESFQIQLKEFTVGPHPFGSSRQKELSQFIQSAAKPYADKVIQEDFEASVPNPELLKNPTAPAPLSLTVKGSNIHASAQVSRLDQCVIIIGSHYDTKVVEGTGYLGANDSGSSSILLLQIMRYLSAAKVSDLRCEIWFTWFDGEESTLADWNAGERIHPAKIIDHLYGSREFAAKLVECPFEGRKTYCMPNDYGSAPVIALILADMVGSPNMKITRETNSTPALRALMQQFVTEIGETERLGLYKEVEDDHVPFLKRGVYALNIIDFENIQHWHQPSDIPANLSTESIEFAAKVVSYLALTLAADPQVILQITE